MTQTNSTIQKSSVKERKISQVIKDYWLLMKPELTLLSVFTSLCSAYIAIQVPDELHLMTLPLLVLGTLMVGGGSGALNQFTEWKYDAMMKRTVKRPVPDERLTPRQAVTFGITISLLGTITLLMVNWLSAFLALSTLLTYVFLYTPLKRITILSTVIGAIPGALPTLIGWAAVRDSLSIESLTLFAILFYWQMPHFYSIGWMYRFDYTKAGFKLLTTVDQKGKKVASRIVMNLSILTVVGMSPAIVGLVHMEYIGIAFVDGLIFLYFGIQFAKNVDTEQSTDSAKRLFFVSLFYLPIIFTSMIVFKMN